MHSAIGYVTPNDRLLGNDAAIHAARDRSLAEARDRRKPWRQSRHEQLQARADASRPALDFAAVRAAITMAQVLALLGFVPRSDHAGQQRGACPLHGVTSGTARCFSVNTQAHTFPGFKYQSMTTPGFVAVGVQGLAGERGPATRQNQGLISLTQKWAITEQWFPVIPAIASPSRKNVDDVGANFTAAIL